MLSPKKIKVIPFKENIACGKKICITLLSVLFFYPFQSLPQTPSDGFCPMLFQYPNTNKERRFVVNPTYIEELTRSPSTYADIPLAQEIFIQTIIEAADRLNKIGAGTHVYAGTSTETNLPNIWNGTSTGINASCADENRRNLVVIKISGSENPLSLAARVLPKCLFNGTYYGYQIEYYMKNSDSSQRDKWFFSVNGNGFSMATAAIHEFGHTYNVEHSHDFPPQPLPPVAITNPPNPPVSLNAVMNSPTRILKEWDISCMVYRSGQRSYSLLFRDVTSSGIGSEQVYINASASPNSGVADFAPGKFTILWSTIDSLIYELLTVTRWHQNVSIGTVTDVTPPIPSFALDTGFQVWQEEPGRVPKYIWAQINNNTNWDTIWRLRVRNFDFSLNNWQPNNNSNFITRGTPAVFVSSQFVPSIAHLNSATFGQRTISVWSESDSGDIQTTRISSGTIGSTNILNPKNLTYTLPNGTQGMLNPYVPMSIACRNTDDLCLVAFIANDFYDSGISNPLGWRNKNAVMIGQVNLQDLINGTGTSTNLINVQGLPNLVVNATMPSVRMRSASKPLILFDGTNFRVIFRGSYMAGQKLTAFRSTNGINWIHDTVFNNMMSIPFDPFNNHTSYSSVAPTAAAYMNGATRIYYSRPLTTSY
jgi:hypothetical protein